MGNAEYMGSLEKLLELKHSRWSLLWFCCPFSVLPLPSGSTQAQCPELSLPLAAWSNSRPGSWVSSSTLLMPRSCCWQEEEVPPPSRNPARSWRHCCPAGLDPPAAAPQPYLSVACHCRKNKEVPPPPWNSACPFPRE